MLIINVRIRILDEQQKNLFETFGLFHKLNFSSILPDISQGVSATLRVIEHSSKESGGKGAKISTVAEKLHVAPSAVCRTLRSLEEKDLVLRTVDSSDRRNTYVVLTDKGRQLFDETEKIMSEFLTSVLNKIDAEDIERLNLYLRQIYEVAQEEIALRKCQNRKDEAEDE
ncbi:MAG: winged helix DNA-binding protein [Actinobacteria bacterium]|nr:winged helix DNA-binding protein [Actinomycetota bacterium]